MPIEHHDLLHEFPEHRDRIHDLKVSDAHFARLFDEYHQVTKDVERMESEVEAVCTQTEETAKLRRLHLKDQLHGMIIAAD